MTNFDNLYEEEMMRIEEGAFKSLATAGVLGLGALAGGNDAQADYNRPAITQRVSDETILSKTLPLTKWAEGFRDTMYKDSVGVPTIGYGSNLNSPHIQAELEKLGYSTRSLLARNDVIKEKDAEIMLNRGMVQALKDAQTFVGPEWHDLDPIAKIVVLDMSYNLGLTRLSKFKNFKSALEQQDYRTAGEEMIDSEWYGQVGWRSKRLADMMNQLADRT